MKIAFQDQFEWKGFPHAEMELGARMKKACENLGHKSIYSSNFGDIEKFNPDIVFPLHQDTPKMFDAYTIGCMWNPIDNMESSYNSITMHCFENIKSYDAFAISSPKIKNYLDTLCFKSPFIREQYLIYPSSNKREYVPVESFNGVAYIGSNWQGDRHKDLFLNCDNINVYGPSKSWQYLADQTHNYKGEVPFGGDYVFDTYRENGIGLCFHSQSHLQDNIPNMRVFEMAAAGIVIFADKLKFIEESFGDSVIYIDTEKSTKEIIAQINCHYNWVLTHQEKAREMAKRANEIFNEKYCLEKLIGDIIDEYQKRPITKFSKNNPSVEIIMRTNGNRPSISDSIKSIVNQSYRNISLSFVYWGNEKAKFSKLLGSIIPDNFSYRILKSGERKDRSYNLYYGIRNAKADYIGFCDDDDILFKNHVEKLVGILEKNKGCSLAYSGAIMKEIKKNSSVRDLAYFHDFFDFEHKSYITSNSYLVKRKDIPSSVLINRIPNLAATEDRMFLDSLYYSGCKFVFSEMITSLFTRDKKNGGNASSNNDFWAKEELLYRQFLRKSDRVMEYVDRDEKEKAIIREIKYKHDSRLIIGLRYILRKFVPHRVRRYILLMVKELVSSSAKI